MNSLECASDAQFLPRLHHASIIRADSSLANTITTFVNQGYRYFSPKNALRWNPGNSDRLTTADSIHQVLGNEGLFAVVYHPDDKITPIACAATKQWTGDYGGYVEATGDGWEILTVTTRVEWMRRGLARRCVDALVENLIMQARSDEKRDSNAKLRIWVHAVEDLNGAYWKKQGWVEVRSYDKPAGEWGSKLGYRLLVLLQEFDVT
jgi:GNAT superfamily N-acetyltransferase